MNHPFRLPQVHRCVSAILTGLVLTIGSGACVLAQDAPENDTAAPQAAPGPATFNWHDIPPNETVPIQRASFDAGGYQLLDSQGQTIIVPFLNNSLYVMKFAQSTNGTMYFVNDGTAPILYVPQGAYLQNLTVPGAFWYPPSPVYPVYYGIAPSWDAYVAMGWYPGMHYWGGYWSSGGVYIATPGLYFEIGGTRYVGWARYDRYYHAHEGWRHVGYRDRGIYHRGYGSRSEFRSGRGVGHSTAGRYNVHHEDTHATGGSNRYTQHSPTRSIHEPGAGAGFKSPGGTTGGFKSPGGTTGGFKSPGGTTGGFKSPGGTTGGFKSPGGTTGGSQRPTFKPGGGTGGGTRSPSGGGSPSHPSAPAHSSGGSGGTKKP